MTYLKISCPKCGSFKDEDDEIANRIPLKITKFVCGSRLEHRRQYSDLFQSEQCKANVGSLSKVGTP
jgi:hypothetical protein